MGVSRMGNARKFLELDEKKREQRKKISDENDLIEVHQEFAVTTKCPDSERNTETKLNKSKLGFKDRSDAVVYHAYDSLLIEKDGIKYRLKQLYQRRTHFVGVTFKATPVSSVGSAFDISEKVLKTEIAKERITIVKED